MTNMAICHEHIEQRSIQVVSDEIAVEAVLSDATAVRIMSKGLAPHDGDLVGVRLNLNLLKNKGVPIQTIHAGNHSGGHIRNKGLFNGAAIAYQKVVTLKNAYFNVSQSSRENIASGKSSKFPMASVDGIFVESNEINFNGVEIRFNPKRAHLFTDMNDRPVRCAEEVTIYAHRAYARGAIEYYTIDNAPEKAGDALSMVNLS